MGLHAAKSWLGSLRKFQKQPLGPKCDESCFITPKTQVFHWSLATKLYKNIGSPNLSVAPLKTYNVWILCYGFSKAGKWGGFVTTGFFHWTKPALASKLNGVLQSSSRDRLKRLNLLNKLNLLIVWIEKMWQNNCVSGRHSLNSSSHWLFALQITHRPYRLVISFLYEISMPAETALFHFHSLPNTISSFAVKTEITMA